MNNLDPDVAERPDDLIATADPLRALEHVAILQGTCETFAAAARRHVGGNIACSMASMARPVEALLELEQRGAVTFGYGNNIRAQAAHAGVKTAFDIPGLVPEYVRPLFCEGKRSFRSPALSGDSEDTHVMDTTCGRGISGGDSPGHLAWNHAADEAVHSATPVLAVRGPVPVAG
jgi:urocanate hydratase